jgi:hypothetical protein
MSSSRARELLNNELDRKSMNKENFNFFLSALFIASLVAVTFVGNVYYNISMQVFIYGFSIASMILVGIGRVFFKGDQKALPEPTKENKLRASIAGCAALSGLAVFIGIGAGLHTISYFEKAGSPRCQDSCRFPSEILC